jgi:predicted secreted protein
MSVSCGIGTLNEAQRRQQLRRAVLASTVGTAIEWYDFFLYSTVTGLVFAQLYFPRAKHSLGRARSVYSAWHS